MIILIQTISLLLIFHFLSNSLFSYLKLSEYIKSTFGLAFFTVTVNFFYFTFNLNFKTIFYFYISIFIFSVLTIKRKDFQDIIKVIKFVLPLTFFFSILIFFYGVQYYIFRGNPWDFSHIYQ